MPDSLDDLARQLERFAEDRNWQVQDDLGLTLQQGGHTVDLQLRPPDVPVLEHPHHGAHPERTPLFMARERAKLQAFIREHVCHGDTKGALYAIDGAWTGTAACGGRSSAISFVPIVLELLPKVHPAATGR